MEQTVGAQADNARRAFFQLVFGKAKGYVCIAYMKNKKFQEEYYRWPEDFEDMLIQVGVHANTHNVYFCPQLLKERKRDKSQIEICTCAWSDLDTCDPSNLDVTPSIVLESSPGRYQAFWIFDSPADPDDAEDLSRRIAYKHAEEGADRSGWDLTQLLRVPNTVNLKYEYKALIPVVKTIHASRTLYRMSDFSSYPASPEYIQTDVPMPSTEDLSQLDVDDLLQSRRKILNPMVWRLYSEEPQKDWSAALWNLEVLLFEAGYNRVEVYAIALESKCNKYARDGRSPKLLWKDVCRAEIKQQHNADAEVPEVLSEKIMLLTDEERAQVDQSEDTFVERYQEWASSLGDAAPQYHQAGAFVILSSILSGSVRLPTSYGTIVPNMWFMILADTTLTRKTTSMDIAMDLLMELDDDAMMATDGSIEGLLTALSARPGRPSVFLRDEFSGLLEQMTKKDYMAGMPELLTKLYDGKMQKRILRKEVIEVRDPRLIFFAGGIKTKITSLLTTEHVSSGFMPRFVFITAESDLNRLKPIGPPTVKTTGNREAIEAELIDMYKHYNRAEVLNVGSGKASTDRVAVHEAILTDEAWVRYNMLESVLLDYGLKSQHPEIMTPVGDRLAKSILKAAVLIASSRQKREEVVVELIDLLRAMKYGEKWRAYVGEVMLGLGKKQYERDLDRILNAITKKPEGIPRSKIMQTYHITARDANNIFDTLEQRGQISRHKSGRTELLVPRLRRIIK